jgi:carbonic anhydrase
MGQRLFSEYSVAPVPRNLIPSLDRSKPQVLWLGCCDSGYDETTTLDLFPEEMIVVRNIGNLALGTDLTWASAVQHAVDNLQVLFLFLPKENDTVTNFKCL